MADEAGVDIVLVGDSLGMVVMGLGGTVEVTMENMIHHTQAVTRGATYALIIGDMPFMSYNSSERDAILNAGRFMKEGGADAVKLEGGASVKETVRAIVWAGIPVMGHIGLTPQTATSLGGFKVQGKNAQAARQLIDDARALEEAGCALVTGDTKVLPREALDSIIINTSGIGITDNPIRDCGLKPGNKIIVTGTIGQVCSVAPSPRQPRGVIATQFSPWRASWRPTCIPA